MSLSVCVSVSLYVESIHLFIQELLTSHCCSPVAEASLFLGGVVRCVVDSLFPCDETLYGEILYGEAWRSLGSLLVLCQIQVGGILIPRP